MRKFYILIQKGATLSHQLTWSHYVEIIKLNDVQEIKYYTYISETQNLSVRELRERIKSNEYGRIGYKEELKEPKINTLIKNPIIINTRKKVDDEISEYALHQFILEDMENFLKEFGNGFAFIGHEVKINTESIPKGIFSESKIEEKNCRHLSNNPKSTPKEQIL